MIDYLIFIDKNVGKINEIVFSVIFLITYFINLKMLY